MTDRPGLYVMMVLSLIGIVGICERTREINSKLENMPQNPKTQVTQITDVTNGRTNQFYQIGNQRAYTMINNAPASDYVITNR